MKKQARQIVSVLLAVIMLAATVLGLAGPAAAGTTTLSALPAGSTVQFAGYTWIVLDNGASTGNTYLLMQGFYGNDRGFDTASAHFDPSISTNLAYYLNTTFLSTLSGAAQAMIPRTNWTTDEGSSQGVSCKIGLISADEYIEYGPGTTGGAWGVNPPGANIINPASTTDGWWTRTYYAGPDAPYQVDSSGNLNGSLITDPHAVRPALYLDATDLVSSGSVVINPSPAISRVVLSPASNIVGQAQSVSVAVYTNDVADGANVTASLTDSGKNALTPPAPVTGTINNGAANLALSLPGTLSAGGYYVKVAVQGVAAATYAAYTVNPPPAITNVILSPSGNTAGVYQQVGVYVTTSSVSDGAWVTASLVDSNKNDLNPPVSAPSQQIASNYAFLMFTVPTYLGAGSYYVKVTVQGVAAVFYTPYSISQVPSAGGVTLTPNSSLAGVARSVAVAVYTSGVADRTGITASLADSDKNNISSVTAVSGQVYNNAASLTLRLPDTLGAGNYYVAVAVYGVATHVYTAYTIDPSCIVAVSANPAAGGNVTGGGVYAVGAPVTVTATPSSGYTFTNWTEGGTAVSSLAAYIFHVLAAGSIALVANFTAIPSGGGGGGPASAPAPPSNTVPTVTTGAASSISQTQATLNGSITNTGNAACTQVDFGYRPQGASDWQYTTTQDGSFYSGAQFSATVTGLSPGTAYEFEARACNSAGWGEGPSSDFTTTVQVVPPTVATLAASGIVGGTATLNGMITNSGGGAITASGFRWIAVTGAGANSAGWLSTDVSPGSDGSLTYQLTGLAPDTTYSFLAYATNSSGTGTGSNPSFQTPSIIVTTQAATDLGLSAATLNGSAAGAVGSVSSCGFLYGTGTDPSQYTRVPADTPFSPSGNLPSGSFSKALTGLAPGVTYNFIAYVSGATGETDSASMSFTTLTDVPVVNTLTTSAVAGNSATLNGYITKNNGLAITDSGFLWGTGTDTSQYTKASAAPGSDGRTLSYALSGLSGDTTYYFQAYATNADGTGYGPTVSFTTPAAAPTVTGSAVFNAVYWAADLDGNIVSNGGAPITGYGFRWSYDQNFWSDLPIAYTGSEIVWSPSYGMATFPVVLEGSQYVQKDFQNSWDFTFDNNESLNQSLPGYLKNLPLFHPGATYYFQAYAANSQGTGYSSILSLTPPVLPTVTAVSSALTANGGVLQGSVVANGGAPLSSYGFRIISEDAGVDPHITMSYSEANFQYLATNYPQDYMELAISQDYTGDFTSQPLTGLAPGATFYWTAFATSPAGVGTGSLMEFTAPNLPQVTANIDKTTLKSGSVTLGGNITDTGAQGIQCTETSFQYRPAGSSIWIQVGATQGSFGTGAFSFNLTGLIPGTTYEFQAQADNLAGWGSSPTTTFVAVSGSDKETALNMKEAGFSAVDTAGVMKDSFGDTDAAAYQALQYAGFEPVNIATALKNSDYQDSAQSVAGIVYANGLDAQTTAAILQQVFNDDSYGAASDLLKGGYQVGDVAGALQNVFNLSIGLVAGAIHLAYPQFPEGYTAFPSPDPELDSALFSALGRLYGEDALCKMLIHNIPVYYLKLTGLNAVQIAGLVKNADPAYSDSECAHDLFYYGGFSAADTGAALAQVFTDDPAAVFSVLSQATGIGGVTYDVSDITDFLVNGMHASLQETAGALTAAFLTGQPLVEGIIQLDEDGIIQLLVKYYQPAGLSLASALYAAGWNDADMWKLDASVFGVNLQGLADGLYHDCGVTTPDGMIGILKQLGLPPLTVAYEVGVVWPGGYSYLPAYAQQGYTASDAAAWLNRWSTITGIEVTDEDAILELQQCGYGLSDIVLAMKTAYGLHEQNALNEFEQYTNYSPAVIVQAINEVYGGQFDLIQFAVQEMEDEDDPAIQIAATLKDDFQITDPVQVAGYLKPGFSENQVIGAVTACFLQPPYTESDALKLALQVAAAYQGGITLPLLHAVYQAPESAPWFEDPDATEAVRMMQGAGLSLDQIVQLLKTPPLQGYGLTAIQALDLLTLGNYTTTFESLTYDDSQGGFGYQTADVLAAVEHAYGTPDIVMLKLQAIKQYPPQFQDNLAGYGIKNGEEETVCVVCLSIVTLFRDLGVTDIQQAAADLQTVGYNEYEVLQAVYICSGNGGGLGYSYADALPALLQNLYGANDPQSFAAQSKQYLGNVWICAETLAPVLLKVFPSAGEAEIALALKKVGYSVSDDDTSDITYWLLDDTPHARDDALAAVLGTAHPGDLGIEAYLAVEILRAKGYNLTDAAAWLVQDKYAWTDMFGDLVDTYSPPKAGSGADNVAPVLTALDKQYDINDLARGDLGFYEQMCGETSADVQDYADVYENLRNAGYSVLDSATILVQLGEGAVPALVEILEEDSSAPSAKQIAAILVETWLTTPGVSFSLQDIANGLIGSWFPETDIYEAVEAITAPYLKAINSDAPVDITALHIMKLAGLSADEAASIEADEGVGLSTGQIIESIVGFSSPWFDAVQNLAAAGYSFSDSISAIWDNNDYHTVIGVSILASLLTTAISKLSGVQMVADAISLYHNLDKTGFMLNDLIKGNYEAAAEEAGLLAASNLSMPGGGK